MADNLDIGPGGSQIIGGGQGNNNPGGYVSYDASTGLYGNNPSPDIQFNPSSLSSSSSSSSSSSTTPGAQAPVAGALGGLAGLGLGAFQTIWGAHQLNQLEKTPFPTYNISPELQGAYNETLGLKDQGLTTGEKASFQSDINRGSATNYAMATKMAGGNLSNAIQGAVNSEQLSSQDHLAAIDADAHRKNLQQYYAMSDQMQQQRNLISQANIQHRMALEQAYGQTLNAGVGNLAKGAASSLEMLAPLLV